MWRQERQEGESTETEGVRRRRPCVRKMSATARRARPADAWAPAVRRPRIRPQGCVLPPGRTASYIQPAASWASPRASYHLRRIHRSRASAGTPTNRPPTTDRAWKPILRPLSVKYRSENGTRFEAMTMATRIVAMDAGRIEQVETREQAEAKLSEFNPWLSADALRSIIETLDAIPATVDGNREMLMWLRGERGWYDEAEKRHRRVQLIDFEHPDANEFHVSWEWTLKPPARKGNRADVMFLVNGVPVCIVEHKNPKDGDAIERGIKQLRRYEIETPALSASRGVYLLTCPKTREQYVGSATGGDGFHGRWLSYARDGHGGNVGLKSRDPSDYQVSILEVRRRVLRDDAGRAGHGDALEGKLQSREMGLDRTQRHVGREDRDARSRRHPLFF